MRRRALILGVLCLLLLSGCGGGSDSGPTPGPGPGPGPGNPPVQGQSAPIRISISWSARSRGVVAPSSALSAVIRLANAGADGSDYSFTVNRDDNPAAYTQTYTSPDEVPTGSFRLFIDFFAQADGGGSPVALAFSRVTIRNEGEILESFALVGNVASIDVPDQTVPLNQITDIDFTARDVEGTALGITPGSVFISVTGGGDRLRIVNGQVQGIAPGSAEVTASVDGKTDTAVITVVSNAVVFLSPSPASLTVSQSQLFSASVSETANQGITWSVQEAGGGTISPEGVYTAPNASGTYHVVATSQFDPTKSAVVTITVSSNISVAINGATDLLAARGTRQFTATVSGTDNQAVTWSVEGGGANGTITPEGLYTAPNKTGTFTIVAVSQADTTKSATFTVNVGVIVRITPENVTIGIIQRQTFVASVTGTPNTRVNWSVEEGAAGGSITQDGVYTAPATPGTYHVIATSAVDPTKSARATVVVAAGAGEIIIQ